MKLRAHFYLEESARWLSCLLGALLQLQPETSYKFIMYQVTQLPCFCGYIFSLPNTYVRYKVLACVVLLQNAIYGGFAGLSPNLQAQACGNLG